MVGSKYLVNVRTCVVSKYKAVGVQAATASARSSGLLSLRPTGTARPDGTAARRSSTQPPLYLPCGHSLLRAHSRNTRCYRCALGASACPSGAPPNRVTSLPGRLCGSCGRLTVAGVAADPPPIRALCRLFPPLPPPAWKLHPSPPPNGGN